jgi:hypothetical protein
MVRSKAASGDGMEQGMLNDSSTHNQSVSDPPPILRVAVDPQKDPSPISMPSTSSIDRTAQVSATRVEYDATDTGVLFSVPVTSEYHVQSTTVALTMMAMILMVILVHPLMLLQVKKMTTMSNLIKRCICL